MTPDLHVLGERHVHRLHAEPAAGLHRRVDLVDLALADQVPDRRRGDQHLARHRTALAVGGGDQLLGDHALQRGRQLHAHLLLLVRREHVDDAVDRLGRVLRVQGREHEVAGLGRGDRGRDRLEVTHLADQDHVGVLAQHVLQGAREPVRVGADLPLVHDAGLVLVQELDRVLDRHDVALPLGVHDVDHRGEGRRLTRPGGARHHDEPALEPGEIGDDRRQPELIDLLDLERDHAEGGPDRVPLHVDVHAEPGAPGQRVRHVELELLLEPLAQLLREDRVDHPLEAARRERRVALHAHQVAVHAHRRRRAGRQVQVGAFHIEERAQELGHRDLDVVLLQVHAHRHFTTLATSSIDVMPIRHFSRPSSRRLIIPCCTATVLIASADARSTVSRSISSLICITSYSPIRPR